MTLSDSDRRLFERFSARFPLKIEDSSNSFGSNVFLRDFSAGGINFFTREKIDLNDKISLLVKLPDGKEPLILDGFVVWFHTIGPYIWNIGLKFSNIKLMGRQRLFKFCEQE